MAVSVLEHCKISPRSGSISPTSLSLTIFDILWLPVPPVEKLFFYKFHHSKAYFMETILPNIRNSLSITLENFFPLAGNLVWPHASSKPEIMYVNGDFVSMIVAESDNDFDTLVDGRNARSANAFYPLVTKLRHAFTEKRRTHHPLLAIQVTVFPNQGICIGITYNHVAADGRTIHDFIKSWASMCKLEGKENTPLHPCYDRHAVNKNPSWVDAVCLNYMEKLKITRETFHISKDNGNPMDKVLSTFVMDNRSIEKLRQWVLSRLDNKPLRLSAFVLTCAYVWVCLIKARWGDIDAVDKKMEYFLISVDSRVRLDPPLPVTYFGNCIRPTLLEMKRKHLLGKDGMLLAAELIASAIQTIGKGDAIFKYTERFLYDFAAPAGFIAVAGATTLGTYGMDFGWGKPKKAEYISITDTGAISICECPTEEGAVEVGLASSASEMHAFATLFANTIEDF